MSEQQKKRTQLKCFKCKNLFDKEDLEERKNKKYCPKCLIIYETDYKKNTDDWGILFKYICSLFKLEIPTLAMFQQIKTYRGTEYNLTNIGMYYTLKYYYEVLENPIKDTKEDNTLGIIPYYYERAKRHYNRICDIEDMVDKIDLIDEEPIIVKSKINKKQTEIKKPLPLNIFDKEEQDEVNEENT